MEVNTMYEKRNEFYVTKTFAGCGQVRVKYKERKRPPYIITFAELARLKAKEKNNAEKN